MSKTTVSVRDGRARAIGAPLPEGRKGESVGTSLPNDRSSIPTGPYPGPGERSRTGATPCAHHRRELSATDWTGCQPACSSSIRDFSYIAADVSRLLAHSPPLGRGVTGATRHRHQRFPRYSRVSMRVATGSGYMSRRNASPRKGISEGRDSKAPLLLNIIRQRHS